MLRSFNCVVKKQQTEVSNARIKIYLCFLSYRSLGFIPSFKLKLTVTRYRVLGLKIPRGYTCIGVVDGAIGQDVEIELRAPSKSKVQLLKLVKMVDELRLKVATGWYHLTCRSLSGVAFTPAAYRSKRLGGLISLLFSNEETKAPDTIG